MPTAVWRRNFFARKWIIDSLDANAVNDDIFPDHILQMSKISVMSEYARPVANFLLAENHTFPHCRLQFDIWHPNWHASTNLPFLAAWKWAKVHSPSREFARHPLIVSVSLSVPSSANLTQGGTSLLLALPFPPNERVSWHSKWNFHSLTHKNHECCPWSQGRIRKGRTPLKRVVRS